MVSAGARKLGTDTTCPYPSWLATILSPATPRVKRPLLLVGIKEKLDRFVRWVEVATLSEFSAHSFIGFFVNSRGIKEVPVLK